MAKAGWLMASVAALAAVPAVPAVPAGAQGAPAQAGSAQERATFPTYPGQGGPAAWTVAVTVEDDAGARRFALRSDAPQRDDAPSTRTITERAGDPRVRSGSPLFDALFAQAVDDAHRASVEAIRDDAYDGGRPIACSCFETGEKWHYVWTRDLSYALDLGLAGFDPQRAVHSLLFKTSGFRPGVVVPAGIPAGSMQIVQDTGSGGSWPVSTDRTSWALGAERTLANLDGAARAAFAAKALAALKGTLEADRIAAFDARDGLYGGEHSFLDWREQSYAPWIVDDLSWMAQSKGLSTNIVQYRAMRLAARLAREAGDAGAAARYDGWADALRGAIDAGFWDAGAGMYATYLSADLYPRRVAKYDLLGNALAIVSGIADAARGREILSHYPVAPYGPPVVWPQAPGEFVYHNRAQWPFVTTYALKAAAAAGHVAAADRAAAALVRGAGLSLSNMENLEWLTGLSRFDDGPEINSRRQLWSVGGYYGFVTGTVFGWQPGPDGVAVRPFLTSAMRAMLGAGERATLDLHYLGREVRVVLRLPAVAAAAGGLHRVRSVTLNGRALTGPIVPAMLAAGGNVVEVAFDAATPATDRVTQVPTVPPRSHDDPRVFMPATPEPVGVARTAAGVAVTVRGAGLTLLRDGRAVAARARAGMLVDPAPLPAALSACYTVVATDAASGLASQPSRALCLPGTLAQTIAVADARVRTDAPRVPAGEGVAEATVRLAAGRTLAVRDVAIARRGRYAIALRYDNHVFQLNTGVTNAVKRLTVTGADGAARSAVVQMPHVRAVGDTHPLRPSTRVVLDLAPGRYTLALDDFFNMSALASNANYSGPGGVGGAVNEARVAAITIDAVED